MLLRILTFISLAIAFTQAAQAFPTYNYFCQSNVLKMRIKAVDKGRTYPGTNSYQHTYDTTYLVQKRADNSVVLSGQEETQAYVDSINNGVIIWDFSTAYNPNGGSFPEPQLSIWIKADHRGWVDARYYRAPYPNHRMRCRML